MYAMYGLVATQVKSRRYLSWLWMVWATELSYNKTMFIAQTRPIILPHDDVIKWKHFPRYWPFVRGIHRSPVNSPHKGQWRGALMFSLICPNKRLSKQWRGWWFETPSCSLWRHCNAMPTTTWTQVNWEKAANLHEVPLLLTWFKFDPSMEG